MKYEVNLLLLCMLVLCFLSWYGFWLVDTYKLWDNLRFFCIGFIATVSPNAHESCEYTVCQCLLLLTIKVVKNLRFTAFDLERCKKNISDFIALNQKSLEKDQVSLLWILKVFKNISLTAIDHKRCKKWKFLILFLHITINRKSEVSLSLSTKVVKK